MPVRYRTSAKRRKNIVLSAEIFPDSLNNFLKLYKQSNFITTFGENNVTRHCVDQEGLRIIDLHGASFQTIFNRRFM